MTTSLLSDAARAAAFTGLRQIELREFPIPQPGEGELLVLVEGFGIWGTDAHGRCPAGGCSLNL